jgi:hypothetical protein
VVPAQSEQQGLEEMKILSSGTGEFRFTDLDAIGVRRRDRVRHGCVDATGPEADDVSRVVVTDR